MIGLLSIPTWIIHFGSVIEWMSAMTLFYFVGRRLHNVWLQRMPLAMIPYLLSGFCALIYHMSYDTWNWINEWQSYLTFLGSCCFALWAFLLLRSITAPQKSQKEGRRG